MSPHGSVDSQCHYQVTGWHGHLGWGFGKSDAWGSTVGWGLKGVLHRSRFSKQELGGLKCDLAWHLVVCSWKMNNYCLCPRNKLLLLTKTKKNPQKHPANRHMELTRKSTKVSRTNCLLIEAKGLNKNWLQHKYSFWVCSISLQPKWPAVGGGAHGAYIEMMVRYRKPWALVTWFTKGPLLWLWTSSLDDRIERRWCLG